MRAFVTGASGFVGGWLLEHLLERGDDVEVLDEATDVAELGAARAQLADSGADVVYHLAALTHVGRSWDEPSATFRVNAIGTVEVLEAARRCVRPPRVVLISSAEVYGSGNGTPIDEDAPLRPVTPYAASKVAAEYAGLQAFLGRGLDVVRARPFNHVGPGQEEFFVVAGLARRIAEAERSGTGTVAVGNLDAARDFTDVRDVVRAYRLLAERGAPGEVYNVCSGRAVSISELFSMLVGASTATLVPARDASLFRPVDVPVIVGSASRLAELTGWRPEIPLSTTLGDVLEHWRKRLD